MKNRFSYFFHNISWLFKRRLKSEVVSRELIEKIVDFEVTNKCGEIIYKNMKGPIETIDLLISSNKSIARFGDGECNLILGNDIPFQKASHDLTDRLINVLTSKQEGLLIGIPKSYFSDVSNLDIFRQKFILEHGKTFRDTYNKYIESSSDYYDSAFTVPPEHYNQSQKEEYFETIQKIWKNKDICIVCGKTVFSDIKYNIFESAKNIEYIYCASKDAFSEYDLILNKILHVSKDKLIIAVLGPTATILSHDLCKYGYRCLDLGHIAKSFDWFKKNKEIHVGENIVDFYAPD